MKCENCQTEGATKDNFKIREVHALNRSYYICRRCGAANRALLKEMQPRTHWAKKALAESKEIRSKMLRSIADINFTILVWGPGAAASCSDQLHRPLNPRVHLPWAATISPNRLAAPILTPGRGPRRFIVGTTSRRFGECARWPETLAAKFTAGAETYPGLVRRS